PAKRSLGQQWKVVSALRRESFDIAFNFSGADRTIFVTALIGARRRVAHAGSRRHFWSQWLIPHWVPRQDPDLAVFEQHRQFLAACGLPLGPPRFELVPDALPAKWAAQTTPDFAIHISPNSAKATREWPLDHHVTFLRSVW